LGKRKGMKDKFVEKAACVERVTKKIVGDVAGGEQ
jgi:hypothetical protein